MKRIISVILVIILTLSALSISASADAVCTGRILVGLKETDTPVRAKDLLPGFEVENGDALYGNNQSGSCFVLRLADKKKSATESAIQILRSHPAVGSAYSEEYVAKESAPGQVLVIPKTVNADMDALFKDFAVESIRQLMKADRGYPPIYLVTFEEKTTAIVMDAIEALSQKVRIIEPDWITYMDLVEKDSPEDKLSAQLKEELEKYPYRHAMSVYIAYADPIEPPIDGEPSFEQYQAYLEERENQIFDEIFSGIFAHVEVKGMSGGVIALVDSVDIEQIAGYDIVGSVDVICDSEGNFNSALSGYVGAGCRFTEAFRQQYGIDVYDSPYAKYDEVRYHYDENGEIDWAIVNYVSFAMIGNDVIVDFILCDKHIYLPCECYSPFIYGYGLYDAKTNTFTDLRYLYLFDEYEGLEEAFRSLDLSHLSLSSQVGQQIWGTAADNIRGDADGDSRVTVLDATKIQKCKAGLVSRYAMMSENADADRDGVVTVLDATRIQKYKANLCTLDGDKT